MVDLLDLLRALPEEKIRTDGGAEHRHDHRGRRRGQRRIDTDQAQAYCRPVQRQQEQHPDIGQQAEGQHRQDAGIAAIGHQHLQRQREEGKENGEAMPGPGVAAAQHQLGGFAHRRQVGADIDDIGRKEQSDQPDHDLARHHPAHVGGEPCAGDAADAGADQLHRHHQGKGQQHGPEQVKAELRPRLGIAGDAAGIVICRPGDQARAKLPQRARAQPRGKAGFRRFVHVGFSGRETG